MGPHLLACSCVDDRTHSTQPIGDADTAKWSSRKLSHGRLIRVGNDACQKSSDERWLAYWRTHEAPRQVILP